MKRILFALAAVPALTWPQAARADEMGDLRDQVRTVMDRIDTLQKKQEEQEAKAKETPAPAPAAPAKPPSAALGGPFTVDIYGLLLPFVDSVRISRPTFPAPADGASQVPASAYAATASPNRQRVTVGSSLIGFRGKYAFSPDASAVFQIEAGAPIDGSPGPNTFGSRNSWAGLRSETYGFIFAGVNYTPYFYVSGTNGYLKGATTFDTTYVATPGFNVPTITQQAGRSGTNADASFSRRQGNSINYWSPNLNGFSARLQYAFNEGKGPATPTGPTISPTIASAAFFYDKGPILLKYAYERHSDYFGMAYLGGAAAATASNPSSRDQAHFFAATYRLPTRTELTATFERLSYATADSAVGNISRYSRDAVQLLAVQTFGPHRVALRLARAMAGSCERVGGGACTTNGLGVSGWSSSYVYALAPNTDVYASVWNTRNGRSAQYTTLDRSAVPGEKQTGLGVGLQFAF